MWFDVDKAGLAALIQSRGKSFALFELVQNAWDASPTQVAIILEPIQGDPYAMLRVEDDSPEGWLDLTESFTLFSPSMRAGDAEKRGRFSFGEKLVLALCRKAKIISTGGTILFDANGRHRRSEHRERGTLFEGEIRMTREELNEVTRDVFNLLPPVPTAFNGQVISSSIPLKTATAKLQTVNVDDNGNLRPTIRQTRVEIHAGELGGIYEMGIPVAEADWPWRLNVLQKVPLSLDRSSVTEAFRRSLGVVALNAMADSISPDESSSLWASQAIADARVLPEALRTVLTQRFGERAVVAVPGDPVANATAEANGATVVHGGSLSPQVWANVRKHRLLPTTSQAFPTPKPATETQIPQICPLCKQPIQG